MHAADTSGMSRCQCLILLLLVLGNPLILAEAAHPLPPLIPQDILALPPAKAPSPPVARRDIASLPERSWRNEQGQVDLVSLRPIFFDRDSARLDSSALALLDKAARFIADHGDTVARVLISAHCDETASESYNYRLASQRAHVVRRVLETAKVPALLISVQALGETMPVDESWQPIGRSHNRRVEIHIVLRRPSGLS